jgi:xanthine dehydrogenase accessory factor
MTSGAVARRADELSGQGVPFVMATVVRAQRPASSRPGNSPILLEDGTIEGFVGGVCAEQSVRAYSLLVLGSGDPVLLRILPDADADASQVDDEELMREQGAVTVQNPCLSGGAIEVFREPVLPAPWIRLSAAPAVPAATTAVDPICGMTVAAGPGTPSLEDDGGTVYFCCEGCRTTFQAQSEHATSAR